MIANEIGIDKMTVHSVITENSAMWKIYAKLDPKALTDDQKQSGLSACE